jgi:hypothetical protein
MGPSPLEDSPDLASDKAVPLDDRVSLELLLVSGNRQKFDFAANATVGEVKETVWNHWPQVRRCPPRLVDRSLSADRNGQRSVQTSLIACACEWALFLVLLLAQ